MTEQLPSEFYREQLSTRRQFEERAKDFASITIPYTIRSSSATSTTKTKFKRAQSYCGALVNNLKSKIALSLLPPSTSSFRFVLSQDTQMQMEQLSDKAKQDLREKINMGISSATKRINDEIERQQIRPQFFSLIEQLLIVGSLIVEKVQSKGIIVHTLQSYTAKLDRYGKPEKFCIVEKLYDLPDDITVKEEKDEYELYTMVVYDRDNDQWVMTQELDGKIVGEEKTYKDYMDLPFRFLGWRYVPGDDYPRPYVEDYYDDMMQLNDISELLTRGSLAAAKVTHLVDETRGRTRLTDLVSAPTGAYLHGRGDDVTTVTVGKNFDFQVPMEREQNLKRELARMFLSNESATRPAERVTAYEVQLMAKELEASTLGGIYSSMALEFSKWLVHQIMRELDISFDSFDVEILTGLDALGRSAEAQKLDAFIQRVGALGQIEYLNMQEVLSRYASFDGIDTTSLIKTSQEVAQERQAQQAAMAEQQAQMSAADATGDVIKQAAQPAPQPKQG